MSINKRPDWDNYFIEMARLVSTRGTCDRAKVGSVIVKDKRVLATGYNGSLPGQPHCDDGKPPRYICIACDYYCECQKDYEKGVVSVCPNCGMKLEYYPRTDHDMEEGHCVRVIHSEANAIAQAAKLGHSVDGASIYCTHLPCWNCYKLLVSAGIKEIVYAESYRPDKRLANTKQEGFPGPTIRQYASSFLPE